MARTNSRKSFLPHPLLDDNWEMYCQKILNEFTNAVHYTQEIIPGVDRPMDAREEGLVFTDKTGHIIACSRWQYDRHHGRKPVRHR